MEPGRWSLPGWSTIKFQFWLSERQSLAPRVRWSVWWTWTSHPCVVGAGAVQASVSLAVWALLTSDLWPPDGLTVASPPPPPLKQQSVCRRSSWGSDPSWCLLVWGLYCTAARQQGLNIEFSRLLSAQFIIYWTAWAELDSSWWVISLEVLLSASISSCCSLCLFLQLHEKKTSA